MSPKGWIQARLCDISEAIQGQSPPSGTYNQKGNGLPFYQGKAEFGILYPTPQNWCIAPKKIAEKGDVLISVRAPVGPTNICPEKSCIGRGLAAIRGLGGVDTFFILYLLRAFERVLAGRGTGTTFNAITGDTLRNLIVPLPPLPEQRRIVAKIEELFTRLDAGVEALRKVKAEIKRYRQAVLKHAFEGRLTEEWRDAYKGELETASVLLERIREERKKNAKGKFKERPPVDASELPSLPEGWMWTSFEHIGEWCGGGTPSKLNRSFWIDGTIPWITPKDMSTKMISDSIDKITKEALNNSSAKLIPVGTLLFVVRSGILRRILPTALTMIDATVNQDIKALTPSKLIFPEYLLYYSYAFNEVIRNTSMKSGTTVESIEFPALKKFPLRVSPLPEQHKIVEEIERHFSIADEVETSVDQCLKQAERLRQSILKRAFEGRLVPQDPTDEPAEKLIERIKLEKTKQSNEGKIKQAKRKMQKNNLLRKPF